MTRPVVIPNTFQAQTGNIPLSQLDANFTALNTAINDPASFGNFATDTGIINASIVTLAPAPASLASIIGVPFTWKPAVSNTGAATLNLNAFGALNILNTDGSALGIGALTAGSIVQTVYDGTIFRLLNVYNQTLSILRSYLAGLILSTSGSSTTMTIAAGQATDSTNVVSMTLASLINKTTSAWAVGNNNGGLDTGAIRNTAIGATSSFATNVMTCTVIPTSGTFVVGQEIQSVGVAPGTTITSLGTGTGGLGTYNLSTSPGTIAAQPATGLSWYYWYLIRRPDTGIVDVICSLSAVSPTLPTSYTQFRYIGAALTNGSSQWTGFIQVDNEIYWTTILNDVNVTLSTTATNYTLTVPRRKVKALMQLFANEASNNVGVRVFDPALADAALTNNGSYLNTIYNVTSTSTNQRIAAQANCYTSITGQVRAVADAALTFQIGTLGWSDNLGRNL